MENIYLDNNATTQIDKEVLNEMYTHLKDNYGNPSSIHGLGRKSRSLIEEAREQVAKAIGANTNEIYFTGCGSESDNLAIRGAYNKNLANGKNHIITSNLEHPAVLEVVKDLEKKGAKVTYLKVDSKGNLDLDEIKNAMTDETSLITLMHANNEVGNIYPIAEIAKLAKEKGVMVHTDAIQSFGKIPFNVKDLDVDMASFSAHKIYGPKGIGAIYIKQGVKLKPIILGGHQENGLRAGTENVCGIVGFGKACELISNNLIHNIEKIKVLRDKLEHGILKNIPDSEINGDPKNRLPGTTNVSFTYIEGEAILLNLDLFNIYVSSGSACSSGSLEPSRTLLSMGLSHEQAHASIRFSIGRFNTEKEIDFVLEKLPYIVQRLREISPLYKS